MVRELDSEKVKEIVNEWVNGADIRSIASRLGVSTGAVSKYINSEKEKVPDLQNLRNLNSAITESKHTLLDVLRAATILKGLDDKGAYHGTEYLENSARLSTKYGDKLDEAVNAGLKVLALENLTGKSFQELSEESGSIQAKLLGLQQSIEKAVAELDAKKSELGEVEEYAKLKELLKSMGVTLLSTKRFVEFHKRLFDLDFDEESAGILASELKKHGLTPEVAAASVTRALSQFESLEKILPELKARQRELEAAQIDLTALRTELDGLRPVVEGLGGTIKTLETERGRKEGERSNLRTDIERAEIVIEKLRKELEKIDKRIKEVSDLAILASLVKESGTPYSRDSVFQVSRVMIMGIMEFILAHEDEVLDSEGLLKALQGVLEKMGGRIA